MKIEDSEFGTVICRRSRTSRYVRLRLGPDGSLRATLPPGGTLRHVQQLINESRDELRKIIGEQHSHKPLYQHGQQIGQSHQLEIIEAARGNTSKHTIREQKIIVALAAGVDSDSSTGQSVIRTAVKSALKREAKAYLPRRLQYLADMHGFHYDRVRYANQSGRWGSCSSSGTISLNIALMNLPLKLVDYVLTHELCHTVHLHHQAEFWELVGQFEPNYRVLRKELKAYNPHL
jgi:predicted metal-dependent hydrolase